MSILGEEGADEPLNLCLKDEQRFTDSGNEDRLSPGTGATSSSDDGGSTTTTGGGPEMDSALSVIEQINSLRKFIHEKRLSKFYELYLMQLRFPLLHPPPPPPGCPIFVVVKGLQLISLPFPLLA